MKIIFTLILLAVLYSPTHAHVRNCGSINYLDKNQDLVIRIDAIIAIKLNATTVTYFIDGSKIQLIFKNMHTANKEFHKAIKKWDKCYKGVK